MQKLVILESPYYPDRTDIRRFQDLYSTRDLFAQNLTYARLCLINSLQREEAPLSTALLYATLDVTVELRTQAIVAGHQWAYRSDSVQLYCDLGISQSMASAAEHAKLIQTDVHRRQIWGASVDVLEARERLAALGMEFCPQLAALDERPSAKMHVLRAAVKEEGR